MRRNITMQALMLPAMIQLVHRVVAAESHRGLKAVNNNSRTLSGNHIQLARCGSTGCTHAKS